MARNATGAARAVLSGGDVRAEITQLKDKGLALKEEYNRLLAEHHLTEADVPSVHAWLRTRLVDGRMCSCLKKPAAAHCL